MFDTILAQYLALAGFAALVAFLINALKFLKVIQDGMAQTVSAGINLLFIIVMYVLQIFKPEFNFGSLDPVAMEIATIGNFILQFVVQLAVAKGTHTTVAGTPVIGYSYTLEKSKVEDIYTH